MPKDASAPGALELVRSFVNSIDVERPETIDAMADLAAARVWLADAGINPAGLDPAGLAELRSLREVLRAELMAHSGEADPAASWRQLAQALGSVPVEVRFADTGMVTLEPHSHAGAAGLIATLSAAVYDAVRDGTWARLKACRKHSCLYAFYDKTKNGSGAWCSMDTCGNQAKAARRRHRQRVGAGS